MPVNTSAERTSNLAAFERFMAACALSLQQRRFDKLLLSGYRGPLGDLHLLSVRAIELRGQPHLSVVFHHDTRDITKNWPLAEGLQQLRALIGPQFGNAHLRTLDEELQLAFSRKGRWSLRVSKLMGRRMDAGADDGPAATAHNREKQRLLRSR